MSAPEALQWLEGELSNFPERASGGDLHRLFVQLTERIVRSPDATDRSDLVSALREWLKLRSEPRTMLAVDIAASHSLSELKPDIERLLADVRAGKAFWPYYQDNIQRELSKLS